MKNRFFWVALATFGTAAAASTLDKQVAECAAVSGDLKRLECYDQLARRNNLAQPRDNRPVVHGAGSWGISDMTNPIDDSRTVLLHLFAESGRSRSGDRIVLALLCQSNKTEMYINWSDYLGLDEAHVTARIGSMKAVTRSWLISTDRKAAFYPGSPIPFIKQMIGQDTFIAQVTPYGENPVTATFKIQGLENALVPLRETCKW